MRKARLGRKKWFSAWEKILRRFFGGSSVGRRVGRKDAILDSGIFLLDAGLIA